MCLLVRSALPDDEVISCLRGDGPCDPARACDARRPPARACLEAPVAWRTPYSLVRCCFKCCLRHWTDALGLADAKGRPPPSCVALLKAGEAALYDGRLLHCGGANRSDELRILFYLTFRAATDDGVGGAEALDELQGSLRGE